MRFGNVLIECIAEMKPNGENRPMRILFEHEVERQVIEVTTVLEKDKRTDIATMNNSKKIVYKFKCETIKGGVKIPFELKFDIESCKCFFVEGLY
jgi:hypothetical protein